MKTYKKNGRVIAVFSTNRPILTDAQSALDLMMTAKYQAGTNLLAIDRKAVARDFFILSTGLAGEVLQKFVNYGFKIAIFGDYSDCTSKPLHDFIWESNRGRDTFFPATEREAVSMLANAE